MLGLQISSIDVLINGLALHLPTTGSLASATTLDRIECLHGCLQGVRSWFDVFLNYDTTYYEGFPICVWKQFGCVFFALYRLTVLDDPAWDTEVVRQTCDPSLLLDQVAQNLRQAEGAAGWTYDGTAGPGSSIFARSVKVMEMFKSWVDSLPGLDISAKQRKLSLNPLPGGQQQQQQQQQQTGQLPSSATFPPFQEPPIDIWSQNFWGLWDTHFEEGLADMS
jgi:hypothetical protein